MSLTKKVEVINYCVCLCVRVCLCLCLCVLCVCVCVYSNLVQFMSSGPVVAMELMGDEAIGAWRRLLGPTDSATARQEAQGSVRARFGTDGTQNAGHGSDSVASAARVTSLLNTTSSKPNLRTDSLEQDAPSERRW